MKIILKFILRNIKEKKLRTLLILISITLSTALVFSTLTISGTVKNIITDQLKKYYGDADIIVQRDPQSLNDRFFEFKDEDINGIDYLVESIQGHAVYPDDTEKNIFVSGYRIDDLEKMFEVSYKEKNTDDFVENKVIIGQGEAKDLGLNIGDNIDLNINQEVHSFTIYAIAKPEGLFNYDGKTLTFILPIETLASIYDSSMKVNTVFVKTSGTENLSTVIDRLNEIYNDDFIVKTTITSEEIDENIKNLSAAFSIMLVLVIIISIFIIYTSFKVITMERLPVVGTFRSIGANKKTTDTIMLGESLLYGVVGGIFGCLLGFGILYLMMNSFAYNPYTGITTKTEMIYGFEHIIIAFLTAVFLSFISSLIPIIKVGKMPVRDIVLNNIRSVNKVKHFKLIIGISLLILPFLIMIFSKETSIIIGGLIIIMVVISIVLIVPYITQIFVLLFEKLNGILFKNEGTLAAKNLRNNKNIINNITLLTIGIASILMINSITQGLLREIGNVFKNAKFDISFQHQQADESVMNRLITIEGIDIESINGHYTLRDVEIEEKNDYIAYVWGIDAKEYFEFWDLEFTEDKEQLFDKLGQDRNIITSLVLKEKFGLNKGDVITLKLKNGDFSYKIIGFTNSLLNNGNFIFTDENYLKQDAEVHYFSDIIIRTNNTDDVVKRIKSEFGTEGINIVILEEEEQNNIESNMQMFNLLMGFSIITMIIGIFGVFNNLVVNLFSRKRSLAIYRSIGMSKKQVLKMLIVESLSSGIIAGITGIIGGVLLIIVAGYIMKALFLPLPMYYSVSLFVSALIGGIFVSIVSAIVPSLRSSKMNIIESIKYE